MDEFEEYMDNQKKVLKLLDYIRKVASLRQKLVRSIKEEEWSLFLDQLPVDPKRIRLLPQAEGVKPVVLRFSLQINIFVAEIFRHGKVTNGRHISSASLLKQ